MAHGYLLGSYLSPLTNDEDDRLRFPLRVLEAVRAAWEGPLSARLSVTDWHPRGNTVDDGIAIARAILADPRVLILDDATSSVDPTKEHEIRDALDEVMRGRTTVVIAHRPATIALADRVVLIDEGRIVAEGTHDDLLQTNPRYREVLASALREEEVAG